MSKKKMIHISRDTVQVVITEEKKEICKNITHK